MVKDLYLGSTDGEALPRGKVVWESERVCLGECVAKQQEDFSLQG